MNALERTRHFLQNKPVDRLPFHPIIMRFAAQYIDAPYRDFCLDYRVKCRGMLQCAEDFELDWVTVMSDPWSEAEAFGMEFEYPENDLPIPKAPLLKQSSDVEHLRVPRLEDGRRMMNSVKAIEEYARQVGDSLFIVGWVEGPMAKYADLRGLSDACLDLYDHPDDVERAADIIIANAKQFITAQVEAGAHCIGIGDAACSIIGAKPYRKFFVEREKALVAHIHAQGALAKLHICGNTKKILPDMIATGADIVDVDHLVGSMEPFVDLLADGQVLSGNSDPVSVIQNGSQAEIAASVRECFAQTQGRGIVSAGCEITPDTSLENFRCYREAVDSLDMMR